MAKAPYVPPAQLEATKPNTAPISQSCLGAQQTFNTFPAFMAIQLAWTYLLLSDPEGLWPRNKESDV